MYFYFVRWSVFDDGKLYCTGMTEYKTSKPIASMDDINDIQDLIREEISQVEQVEENALILIDFYSLLRKEE